MKGKDKGLVVGRVVPAPGVGPDKGPVFVAGGRKLSTSPGLDARRQAFVRALAEFLAGTNQARMSIALALPAGQLKEVAELWRELRAATPLFGYPSAQEAETALRTFLWP